ncbi:hypothetical protein B8W90_13375, partial [Staphylococcus hominis]
RAGRGADRRHRGRLAVAERTGGQQRKRRQQQDNAKRAVRRHAAKSSSGGTGHGSVSVAAGMVGGTEENVNGGNAEG